MNLDLGPVFRSLAELGGGACVLATVLATSGSSYRKAGAMMLLHPDGLHVGLVSGGCLEADLAAHARDVARSGVAREVRYDLSLDDDSLWGLGLGCGGRIRVLLERADAGNRYAGLADVEQYWRAGRFCWFARYLAPADHAEALTTRYSVHGADDTDLAGMPGADLAGLARDRAVLLGDTATGLDVDGVQAATLLVPVLPPPVLTVCGAGPDALPLVEFAHASGWRVRVFDHRPAFADAARFDAGVEVRCAPPAEFACSQSHPAGHAAVIMSHHLQHDAAYLRALLSGPVQYIGLLGPVARREEVLALAGKSADGRLFGPAGYDIGADLPQSIALSILAQAHAVLAGKVPSRG